MLVARRVKTSKRYNLPIRPEAHKDTRNPVRLRNAQYNSF